MEVEAVTPHGIDDKPFDPFPRGPVQSISSLLETSSSPQEDGTTISSTDLDTVALDVVVPSVELDQPAEGRDELDAKSDGTEEGLASPTLSDLEARVESLEEELARAKSNLDEKLTQVEPPDQHDEQASRAGSDLSIYKSTPDPTVHRVTVDKWLEQSEDWYYESGHAILVATEGRITTETPQVGQSAEQPRSLPKDDKRRSDGESHSDKPLRMALNSLDLLRSIEKYTSEPITYLKTTWIRPFRYLCVFEKELRKGYEDINTQLQRLETEVRGSDARLHSDLVTETPSHCNDDVDTTVISDGEMGHGTAVDDRESDRSRIEDNVELQEELKDVQSTKMLWDCLFEFIDKDMKDIMGVRRSIDDRSIKKIEFEYLWHLFKPGDVVYAKPAQANTTIRRAYRVLHVTGGRPILDSKYEPETRTDSESREDTDDHISEPLGYPGRMTPLTIDCLYLDFDGHNWGPRPVKFTISEYNGPREIKDLEVFPATLCEDVDEVRKRMIQRGDRFVKIANGSHKRYYGRSHSDRWLKTNPEEVDGEVIVDQATGVAFLQDKDYNWTMNFGGGVIARPTQANSRETFEVTPLVSPKNTWLNEIYEDAKLDTVRRNRFVNETNLLRFLEAGGLKEQHLELLPMRVYGYALQDRKWHSLNVDDLADISSQPDDAFDRLVLSREHKKLIQALVKNQTRDIAREEASGNGKRLAGKVPNMDLVRGKGRGLIILLHGVPGVGKTSTAECVAAQLHRPLFPITCGDLGTDATTVERRLEEYFRLAQRWGCVLLLDEADVFLAKRQPSDLKRNALVSVFLRVLEYYAGVLMLTTNRIAEFDEAFRSRIHVSIYYPPLEKESTMEIWKMNLRKIEDIGVDFDRNAILRFAEDHWKENSAEKKLNRRWNGRQIKNAFQTALALANWDFLDMELGKDLDRPALKPIHFQDVATTSAHFDDYINEVFACGEAPGALAYSINAAREEIRKDDAEKLDTSQLRWASQADAPYRTQRTASAKSLPTNKQTAEQDGYPDPPDRDSEEGSDSDDNDGGLEDILNALLAKKKKQKKKKQQRKKQEIPDIRS